MPLHDGTCTLATLADGVFLDDNGSIVVVELKCGFQSNCDAHSGNMRREMKEFTDCPRHQHALQVAFTHRLFRETHPALSKHSKAVVVRVVDAGVDYYEPSRRMVSAVKRALERFSMKGIKKVTL